MCPFRRLLPVYLERLNLSIFHYKILYSRHDLQRNHERQLSPPQKKQ